MKTFTTVLAVAVLGAVGFGSYWLGARSRSAGVEDAAAATALSPGASKKTRKLLYYRNPMGLADTSTTPKKDPMGMDYIPVYEGEDESDEPSSASQVRISTEKIQKLGVRVDAVSMRMLGRTSRAAGRVEPDERRVYAVAPKFEGYVERLHVNVTGQPVAKGQPLFEAYSPELVSAQREYAIAMQGALAMKDAGSDAQAGMAQLAESSLTRLRNWDLSPDQVSALTKSGQVQRTVSFRSPVSGIVTEKKALQGMRFMPGEMLYQVTDLSSVWVLADVSEQDVGLIKPGANAKVRVGAYPNQMFEGRITYVYPTLNPDTRTVPVRVELPNPGLRLKPGMFAQVDMEVGGAAPVLTVPDSAVIDTGTRRLVLVQVKEGRFEPREVELGGRGDNFVEIVKGVREGEQVVVAANFLIDAESNLKAAVGGLGGHAGHGSAPKGAEDTAGAMPAGPSSAPAAAAIGHRAVGTVESIDPAALTISMNHGPVTTLKWPAMTMEFNVANAALLAGLKPGHYVSIEFVQRKPGEYVVTTIAAAPVPAASGPASTPHGGH
ncbi:MAG TPA: efflux RND transporter periplasmic adaptor subunit [Ideonella sp.]|uniref:efflux RND transporter periplasmic adaptor subunit n=1 Tax=Ideonella sp. TaxID=1929293 RepID=UPI002E3441ED|nr:efflux RND transporter periplasmic adaptor subunit [Ideonella sp.]HEX5683194.1 efflux RND transporter periplasmic adaptor subunit [Ideonella sp.]